MVKILADMMARQEVGHAHPLLTENDALENDNESELDSQGTDSPQCAVCISLVCSLMFWSYCCIVGFADPLHFVSCRADHDFTRR